MVPVDCKTVVFFFFFLKIGRALRKSPTRSKRASLARKYGSLDSPSFFSLVQDLWLTARAYPNT